MYISLENAIRGASEFLSNEIANMKPSWANAALGISAHYFLQTKGRKYLTMLKNEDGKIDLSLIDDLIKNHTSNLPDPSIATPIGELKITADTPMKLIEHLKRYGEN